MSNEPVDVSVDVVHVTDAAVLVRPAQKGQLSLFDEGPEPVWLPLSKVECEEELVKGDRAVTIAIPEWLREERGL